MLTPSEGIETIKLVTDEDKLPLKENSVDLVLSNLSMHWINDLPNTFSQVSHYIHFLSIQCLNYSQI